MDLTCTLFLYWQSRTRCEYLRQEIRLELEMKSQRQVFLYWRVQLFKKRINKRRKLLVFSCWTRELALKKSRSFIAKCASIWLQKTRKTNSKMLLAERFSCNRDRMGLREKFNLWRDRYRTLVRIREHHNHQPMKTYLTKWRTFREQRRRLRCHGYRIRSHVMLVDAVDHSPACSQRDGEKRRLLSTEKGILLFSFTD